MRQTTNSNTTANRRMPIELWVDKRIVLDNLRQRAEHNGTVIHAVKPVNDEERTLSNVRDGPYRIERIDRRVCQVVYEDVEGIEMFRSEDLDINAAVDECNRLNGEWAADKNSYYKLIQEQWRDAIDEWHADGEPTDGSFADTYDWIWSRANPNYATWEQNKSY